jgi:hypothetical protein
MEYERLKKEVQLKTPENMALHGFKVYSQNDEDGILAAIFSKISTNKTFIEIGVQDGTECNTLFMLLNGWRGSWIEGSKEFCTKINHELGNRNFPKQFCVINSFISLDNINQLITQSKEFLDVQQIDFFSIDIDGNDNFIIEKMLRNGFRPKVFCVEYNGKFPPPTKVSIQYNASHVWDRTEYQGASLQTFVDLFASYDYSLLCCTIAGINAFFIANSELKNFKSYSVSELYQPCRYHLSPTTIGSIPTLRFLKETLEKKL